MFNKPFIDKDEWREIPVKHRYIHGGFKGTKTLFSFYFPAKEQYQGHFLQYITPVPDSETLSQGATGEEDKISFSIASGAYFIETNGGGNSGGGLFGPDPLIGAYLANAATAKYSRVVAGGMYGQHRTFGYCFGGSGGAYRTVGGIENTEGAWDGAVPFVLGSPMAIPNVFSVRMHAMRVLKDKFPQIVDALDAGGSGEEKETLMEATKMGFPPQSWFGHKTMGVHAFPALYQGVVMADKKYFDEFWTVKGYLGAVPTPSLLKARIQKITKIKKGISAEDALKMGIGAKDEPGQARGSADAAWKKDQLPDVDFLGGDLFIKTGKAAGRKLYLNRIDGDKIFLGGADPKIMADIMVGDEVQVDNSNFLAAQTYHRHQVPSKEYTVWNQFRDAEGKPIYPQRPMQLGPAFTKGAAGVLPTAKFKGKMILLESLWDREAYPWQADWYRSKVKENLGDKTDDNFRVWFTDRALHGDFMKQEDPTRTVSYLGVLQQALRDLSNWVEKGVTPPSNTNYKIVDGQVEVPSNATARKGIQPIVHLTVNGGKKVQIKKGKKLTFTAVVEVPPNTGKIVSAEWGFEGAGTFSVPQKTMSFEGKTGLTTVKMTYKFAKLGTYFPTLRVASQREGDAKTPFARIQNLDRVRVVVE
jgi:hypothetical protein